MRIEEWTESGPKDAARVVMLMHGYGADMHDLTPLVQVLDDGAPTRWIFPNAPLPLKQGPFTFGRAWFPIDIVRIQEAAGMRDLKALAELMTPGIEAAGQALLRAIEKLDVDPGKLVLGGFSQGAMMATWAFLHLNPRARGLAVLSGGLAGRPAWAQRFADFDDAKAFIAHGRMDPVVPFVLGERLKDAMREAGWDVEFQEFDGGHEIPPEVCAGLKTWLSSTTT